jgi:hypothetical protein
LLSIAKTYDNTLIARLDAVIYDHCIDLENENDMDNLNNWTVWVNKLENVYYSSRQIQLSYGYPWNYMFRKLDVLKCPYINVRLMYLRKNV